MTNSTNKIITLTFLLILFSACSTSTFINHYENKINDKLELNNLQYQKLKTLSRTIKPLIDDGIKTYSANKRKWRHMLRKQEDLKASELIQMTDKYDKLYHLYRVDLIDKFTDFYNSLDKEQRKEVSEILISPRSFFIGNNQFDPEEDS